MEESLTLWHSGSSGLVHTQEVGVKLLSDKPELAGPVIRQLLLRPPHIGSPDSPREVRSRPVGSDTTQRLPCFTLGPGLRLHWGATVFRYDLTL